MGFNFHRLYKTLFICLLSVLIGCQPKSPLESAMQEYQARLGRVLPAEFEKVLLTQQGFVPKADLKVAIAPIEINLRELYTINGCELATLVANRNSALGKAQLPSQRFIYERELLSTFSPCIETIAVSHPQLAKKLTELKYQKEKSYLANWVSMFQQSDEVYSALTRTQTFISAGNTATYQQALQDWSWLISLQSVEIETTASDKLLSKMTSKKLENTLKRIANRRLPASLWGSEYYIHQQLSTMNKVLSEQLPLVSCNNGKPSDKAKILRNVFVLFFVQEIQPIGSSINNLHYSLIPIMDDLPAKTLSLELKNTITSKMTTDFSTYQSSTQEHIKLWQGFLKRCGLSPIRPSS